MVGGATRAYIQQPVRLCIDITGLCIRSAYLSNRLVLSAETCNTGDSL